MTRSALELTQALRDGTLKAVDLMAQTYEQIDAWNPHVNALVSLRDRDLAMDQARQADWTEPVGPLHGLPIAVKDLANAEGFVTTMGSPVFADGAPANADDIMVARMRDAGAIIIGKTNTPEFGLGSHTFNPVHGDRKSVV